MEQQQHEPTTKREKRRARQSSDTMFPGKLHSMLTYCESSNLEFIVSWCRDGTAFMVHRPDDLLQLLKHFFGQTKYRSFTRQLNMWFFEREEYGPYKGAFHHPYFRKDDKSLCSKMSRIEPPDRNLYRRAIDEPLDTKSRPSKNFALERGGEAHGADLKKPSSLKGRSYLMSASHMPESYSPPPIPATGYGSQSRDSQFAPIYGFGLGSALHQLDSDNFILEPRPLPEPSLTLLRDSSATHSFLPETVPAAWARNDLSFLPQLNTNDATHRHTNTANIPDHLRLEVNKHIPSHERSSSATDFAALFNEVTPAAGAASPEDFLIDATAPPQPRPAESARVDLLTDNDEGRYILQLLRSDEQQK